MKLLFFIALSVFTFLLVNAYLVYSQWELRYPPVPAETITDIAFISDEVGFFTNTAGSIYSTVDGGDTWELAIHFPRDQVKQIVFDDSSLGFALSPRSFTGDQVSLLKTVDGGQTWEVTPNELNDAITFLPLDNTSGIKSHFSGISKSADSFATWEVKYEMPFFIDYDIGVPFGEISTFQKLPSGSIVALRSDNLARDHGVISDSISFVLRSEDSGETWKTLWRGTPYAFQTMHFLNEKIGWLGGEWNTILKTVDGGITWNLQYQDSLLQQGIKSIFAVDPLVVYAISNDGVAFFSNDGGITWETQKVHDNFETQHKIFFVNPTKGFLVGFNGRILVSDGEGLDWQPLYDTFNTQIHAVDFVNSRVGWAGGRQFDGKGFLFKTTDGGYSWTPQGTGAGFIIDIAMLDELKGWAVGSDNVYRTIDGGKNWTSFSFINRSQIRGVNFLNNNFGVIFDVWDSDTRKSYNYVTHDGGENWTRHQLPETSTFFKLKFTDYTHGWMLNSEALWFSADTSKTWTKNTNIDVRNGFSFDFIDNNKGWVAPNFNEVYRTLNGGNFWQPFPLPFTNQTSELMFVDDQRGFISGTNGVIFATNDGGESWVHEASFTSNLLLDIDSYSDGKTIEVWVVGDGFHVLHQTFLISSVAAPEVGIREFRVFQNYPNPFNASTQIEYELPSSAHVILKIYDILGRKVRTLVDTAQNSGSHTTVWDGKNEAGQVVSSGLYVYKLTAGNHAQTKKMLLLR